VTLYGYPRGTPGTDPNGDPQPNESDPAAPIVPHQRVSSDPVPVPVPSVDPTPDPLSLVEVPDLAPDPAAFGPEDGFGALAAGVPVDEPTSRALLDSVDPLEGVAPRPAAAPTSAALDWVLPDDDLEPDEIPAWDRGPLMVALAAGAALVLLAVLSGVVTSAMVGDDRHPVSWQFPPGPPTPVPTTAPAGPVDGDTITLAGVGDVIMGTAPGDLPPRAGSGFFDRVKDALAADLVMGNLETPLTEDTGRVKCRPETPTPAPGNPSPSPTAPAGCHQFYLPPSYAEHLRDAGFHLMTLANNHTNDMGPEGLRNTRDALEAVGIRHTGAPNQITYVNIEGVRVAVIGFAIYSWSQNLNNIPAARALVRKADAEADIVVIQMQGGAEGSDKTHVRPGKEMFLGENRGDLIAFTHAVVDEGADVVFGHGPHIMRGMEFYKGRLIAFSLGNFCGYGVLRSTGFLGVGGVLKVILNRDGSWAGGRLVPTRMVSGGMPAPDSDQRALAFVNGLSRDDFGTAAARIAPGTGLITPPPAS
jgi:hypothetical protein